jgi:uncharacterized MAPEG superfamily protein
MPTEITVLAYAGLLQFVQFVLMALPANRQLGTDYTAGARDEPRALSGVPARLNRAMQNHFEGLILFTLAVVVVTLANKSSGVTEVCAWLYLAARILYVPLYASGVRYLRSVVWAAGFVATLVMLIAALV